MRNRSAIVCVAAHVEQNTIIELPAISLRRWTRYTSCEGEEEEEEEEGEEEEERRRREGRKKEKKKKRKRKKK